MNGIHDMGGMDGFGTVEPEANEPVFHAPWEGRVLAMMRAMGAAGAWNLDMFRDRARAPAAADLPRRAPTTRAGRTSIETLLLEPRAGRAPTRSPPAAALRPAKPLQRGTLRVDDVPRCRHARLLRAARRRRRRCSRPATACARRTCTRRRTRACRAMCADSVGVVERGARLPRLSRQLGARRRRGPAMALHRGLRRPRAVGRRRRSDAEGLGRGVRALSGAGVTVIDA